MGSRKNPTWPVSPALVVVTVAICGFLVASAVGYKLHRSRNEELRRFIVSAELELQRLKLTNELLDAHINNLRSQKMLEQQKQRFGLDLELPRHDQILVLLDPTSTVAQTASPLQLAGKPSAP
jgi:hypothetical protein